MKKKRIVFVKMKCEKRSQRQKGRREREKKRNERNPWTEIEGKNVEFMSTFGVFVWRSHYRMCMCEWVLCFDKSATANKSNTKQKCYRSLRNRMLLIALFECCFFDELSFVCVDARTYDFSYDCCSCVPVCMCVCVWDVSQKIRCYRIISDFSRQSSERIHFDVYIRCSPQHDRYCSCHRIPHSECRRRRKCQSDMWNATIVIFTINADILEMNETHP